MRQNLDMQTTLDSDNASTSGFVGKNLVVFGDFHGPSRTSGQSLTGNHSEWRLSNNTSAKLHTSRKSHAISPFLY